MIKLTDKQINDHMQCYLSCKGADEYDVNQTALEHIINNLNKDQVKQLAESKGYAVTKWIEFDKDDKSTWPTEENIKHSQGNICCQFTDKEGTVTPSQVISVCSAIFWDNNDMNKFYEFFVTEEDAYLVRWCELPQPNENN